MPKFERLSRSSGTKNRQEHENKKVPRTKVLNLIEALDTQRVLWQTFQGYAHARFDLAIALTELERLIGKES
jgi:hypothetical protein